jgi:hypothetical protein
VQLLHLHKSVHDSWAEWHEHLFVEHIPVLHLQLTDKRTASGAGSLVIQLIAISSAFTIQSVDQF